MQDAIQGSYWLPWGVRRSVDETKRKHMSPSWDDYIALSWRDSTNLVDCCLTSRFSVLSRWVLLSSNQGWELGTLCHETAELSGNSATIFTYRNKVKHNTISPMLSYEIATNFIVNHILADLKGRVHQQVMGSDMTFILTYHFCVCSTL